MKLSKTIALTLVLIAALGATSAFAQLAGTWAGTGEGCCYPRNNLLIYPWQNWKGEIPNSLNAFEGEWCDADGNYGIFKGTPVPSIPEIAVFRGEWFWYDPLGTDEPVYGGDFEMIFYFMEKLYCEGTWDTKWPSPCPRGTMEGEKVE